MAQKGAIHLPTGMCLSATMRDSHSVRDLKQMYGKTHPGTSLDKLVITYSGRVLENNDLTITRYGVPPGEYRLVSLGKSSAGDYYSLSIVDADSIKDSEGKVVSIRIRSFSVRTWNSGPFVCPATHILTVVANGSTQDSFCTDGPIMTDT